MISLTETKLLTKKNYEELSFAQKKIRSYFENCLNYTIG
jgi:hypothetical protein